MLASSSPLMNNGKPFQLIRSRGVISALTALGFFVVGMACLLACLAIIIAFPEVLIGDPYRLEVLALATLALPGFVGSFVFGTFYAVSSLLSGTGLGSRFLAILHLILHGSGLCGLVLAMGGWTFMEQPYPGLVVGSTLTLLGILLLVINLVATASKNNRWEPSQITVIMSLFWLTVGACLGLGLLANSVFAFTEIDAITLLQVYIPISVLGFLWLGILGAQLKLISMFLVGSRSPGALSWVGWVLINGALFLMAASPYARPWEAYAIPFGAIFLGSLFYLADIVLQFRSVQKGWTPGVLAGVIGLLCGIGLIGFLGASMLGWLGTPGKGAVGIRIWIRAAGSLAVFGAVTLIFLGMGTRIVPFLVWRLRCLPFIGDRKTPGAGELVDPRGLEVFLLCLATGLLYFSLGQWLEHPAGNQLGALCLLVGIGWFFVVIWPAMWAFLAGVEKIEDSLPEKS